MFRFARVMRNVTTSVKRKRAIKRALEDGTPESQIKKRFKRGHKLIKSVEKLDKDKLYDATQISRGSGGDSKYFFHQP